MRQKTSNLLQPRNPYFSFSRKVNVLWGNKKNPNMKLLNRASDWKVSVDLKTSLQFPVHIIQTEKRPDIVAWSDSKKSVFLVELTVLWEENREEAYERKKNRYKLLRANCVEKGWICHVIAIEVGCRGFLGHSVISFFFKNRNHWPQFESCLKLSSDHGAICIKLDLVESKTFSAWRKYMWSHHSHVIT